MADDPLLAELRRIRQGGDTPPSSVASSSDPLLGELRNMRSPRTDNADAAENTRRANARPAGKGEAALTALVSGIPGVEAMGGVISAMTGGTYQGGRRSIAERQARAKESIGVLPYEGLRLAPEIAGMAAAPVAVAPRVLGTMAGRAALAGSVEAMRGASRAGIESEEPTGLGEYARGAATGGVLGAAGSVGGELGMRAILGAGGRLRGLVGEGAQNIPGEGVIPRIQQAIADASRRLGMGRVADLVEPVSPRLAQRVLREELPTPQSATEFREAAQEAINRANTAGRQAQAARQSTRAEVARVRRVAREGQEALVEQGRQRIGQVRASLRAEQEQARVLVDRARQGARQAVEAADAEVRSRIPQYEPSYADEVRDAIRRTQRAKGDESYQRAFVLSDGVDFSPVARQVEDVVRRNPEVATAYRDAFTRGGAQEAGEDVLPALDLPTFDRMRQNIFERQQAFMRGDASGIPRVRAAEALRDINALENAYVGRIREVRGDEAATALREARAEYAEYFRQLDALADGRNLGRFGFGKVEGRIEPSRLNIANLEARVQQVSPDAKLAFQTGAREFVNDVIRRNPDDARRVAANLVGTEERFRRTALALGEDTANDLRVVFQDSRNVREAARRGLDVAKTQARGAVQQARTQAQVEADRIAAEIRDSRRQVRRDRDTFLDRIANQTPEVGQARAARVTAEQARELSRHMTLARSAVGNADAALGFVNAVLPKLASEGRQAASRVMTTRIDDEIMGLMAQPNGVQKVADRFAELKQNPATRAVLGNALDEAERRLRAGVPLRRPVGAVLGGSLGASMSGSER